MKKSLVINFVDFFFFVKIFVRPDGAERIRIGRDKSDHHHTKR